MACACGGTCGCKGEALAAGIAAGLDAATEEVTAAAQTLTLTVRQSERDALAARVGTIERAVLALGRLELFPQ